MTNLQVSSLSAGGAAAAAASPELLRKLVALLASGGEEECAVCLSPFEHPVITACSHVYCRRCGYLQSQWHSLIGFRLVNCLVVVTVCGASSLHLPKHAAPCTSQADVPIITSCCRQAQFFFAVFCARCVVSGVRNLAMRRLQVHREGAG